MCGWWRCVGELTEKAECVWQLLRCLQCALVFINHNYCVESRVRLFQAPFCAYATVINDTPCLFAAQFFEKGVRIHFCFCPTVLHAKTYSTSSLSLSVCIMFPFCLENMVLDAFEKHATDAPMSGSQSRSVCWAELWEMWQPIKLCPPLLPFNTYSAHTITHTVGSCGPSKSKL